jgi:hypothetical protein
MRTELCNLFTFLFNEKCNYSNLSLFSQVRCFEFTANHDFANIGLNTIWGKLGYCSTACETMFFIAIQCVVTVVSILEVVLIFIGN